jgi:hypothetical protein
MKHMVSKITYEHVDMILFMFVYKDVSMHLLIYKYVNMSIYKQTF